jgi:hypothetical protein
MCSGDDTRPRWCVIYIYNMMLWLMYMRRRLVVKKEILRDVFYYYYFIIIILRLYYIMSEKKSPESLYIKLRMNEFIKRLFRFVVRGRISRYFLAIMKLQCVNTQYSDETDNSLFLFNRQFASTTF